MKIWIWIILALIISLIVLRKQKISFEHYIWLLLPIDMYGISLGGAVIKPYMLFSALLLCRLFVHRNLKLSLRGAWAISGFFISAMLIWINIANNPDMASAKAALMVLIVWACTIVYVCNCGESTFEDIPKVIIAAGVGYGLVFTVGSLLALSGIELPGVIAAERNLPGFFMNFSSMYEGEYISMSRLRGFTIDPNTMIGTFAFCSVLSVLNIAKGKSRFSDLVCMIVSAACILLSNSRMGIICFILLIIISIAAGYKLASKKTQSYIKLTFMFLFFAVIILLLTTDVIQNAIAHIYSLYDNRSGLSDEYGRFTIWKDAISVMKENNPWLGIGMNRMKYYTYTGRACHNTWLELICGSGIIVGGMLVLYFVIPFISCLAKTIKNKDSRKGPLLLCLVLGLLVVIISLITVDNITFSYLWFSTALLCELTRKQNNNSGLQGRKYIK